ncbi:MAG: hypothetical protein ACI3YH_07310 [Eubacteriales bacterium]
MLRKLIAQDMRNQWRTYLMLLLISLGCAIVGSGSMALMNITHTSLSLMGLGLVMMLTLMGAFVALGAISISVIVYYYRKMTTDEAYLTFTLPATAGQILTAKMIVGSIWMLIAAGMVYVNAMIIAIPSLMLSEENYTLNMLAMGYLKELISSYSTVPGVIIGCVVELLNSVVTTIAQLALIYLCITWGSSLSSKHKVLACVGVYIGVNMVVGIVVAILLSIFSMDGMISSSEVASIVTMAVNLLLYAGFTVACHQYNKHLLQNKLNLA